VTSQPESLPSPLLFADDWGQEPERIATWLMRCFDSPDYQPPVLPGIAMRLWHLTSDDDVSIFDVSKVLEEDSMLTASLMRLASSAAYGTGRSLRSIEEVITRLGLRRVRELFFQAAVTERVFKAKRYERPMITLRDHSVTVGYAARMLAIVSGADEGHAFLCGLLHDIGYCASLVALSERLPSEYRPDVSLVWSALVMHHEIVGSRLFESWNLAAELSPVAVHHGSQVLKGSVAGAIVALADALAESVGLGVPNEKADVDVEGALNVIGIDAGTLATVREQLEIFASAGDV